MNHIPRRAIFSTGSLILTLVSASGAMGAPPKTIEVESVLLRIIDQVDVPARVTGALSTLHVVEGQHVETGTALAKIDDTDAQFVLKRAQVELKLAGKRVENDVAVRSAEAALAFAREDLQRLKKAAASLRSSVSESEMADAKQKAVQAELDVEDARHTWEMAKGAQELKQNDLDQSQRNIDLHTISASLGGVVTQVLRRPGEWVKPGDKVIHIVRLDRLRAEGFVRVAEVSGDLTGSPVTVQTDLPGRGFVRFKGQIIFVHPEVDPVNGQMRVWAEIENQNRWLRPGMRPKMIIAPAHSKAAKHRAPQTGRQVDTKR